MRIIAGTCRGRRLKAPPGSRVRPTSDSLRETLFNVLGPTLDGARVLDACAGTGALGLEAISRGAAHATFVERDPAALRVLRENIDACGAAEACVIIRGNFPGALERLQQKFDLILLDPPYEIEDLTAIVGGAASLVASPGRVVLEHSRRRTSPEAAGPLRRTRVLTAGDSALSFYAPESSATRID